MYTYINNKKTIKRDVLQSNNKHEISARLEYYAAPSGNSLPMFQDNLSDPSSSVKKSRRPSSCISWPLQMGPIGRPETSVRNYHSTLCNIPEEHWSHLHHGRSLKSNNKHVHHNAPMYQIYTSSYVHDFFINNMKNFEPFEIKKG
jgi:hypothetical protein